MAVDFPDNPEINEIFSFGTTLYMWDGTKWVIVTSNELPSYVDDVLEFEDLASFPETGEEGKLYIALDTNIIYRWSGSQYFEVSSPLDIASTAEAEAGTNDIKAMTPLKVKQAIDALTIVGSGGQIQFNENGLFGADADLHWDNTNKRLGVGTSSPTQRLTVSDGNVVINTPDSSVSGNGIRISRPSTARYAGFEMATGNSVDWAFGTNFAGFGIYENGLAATTRLNIQDGGNVGIGTTSPSEKLDVNGNIKSDKFLAIDGDVSAEYSVLSTNASYPRAGFKINTTGSLVNSVLSVRNNASVSNPKRNSIEILTAEEYDNNVARGFFTVDNSEVRVVSTKGNGNLPGPDLTFGTIGYTQPIALRIPSNSQNVEVLGNISASNLNISNWNDAYNWGDHAQEGYLTAETGLANVDYYTLTIADTDWTGSEPTTAVKTLSGILSTDRPVIDIDLTGVTFANIETKEAEYAKIYQVETTADNEITLYAKEALAESITINIKVVR